MTELMLPDLGGPMLSRPRAVPAAEYRFVGRTGPATLAALFGRHRRLAVHHPAVDRSRPGATVHTPELSAALHTAGTRVVLVSHAPYAKFAQYGRHFGWNLPGYSAVDTGFAEDFPATRYLEGAGDDAPGLSFFALDRRIVLHLGTIAVPYLDFLELAGVAGEHRRD
ncbi:DUF899 family protein [Amycolatopsis rifamycinica]|uniref:Uncharacterized protein n=1 Tax=Amycolatopsis rifamycinica TaxID=287986 RepID=A0A066TVH1_9PSEU|nr:DUF899 family protein [Amycolatopsis rifamycinica]KDN18855.1 hypothetical protein DV20_28320 [Amycolatopsis rifamycinica]